MTPTKPGVSLSIGEADPIKLALAFRVDGGALQELATADCGRLGTVSRQVRLKSDITQLF